MDKILNKRTIRKLKLMAYTKTENCKVLFDKYTRFSTRIT